MRPDRILLCGKNLWTAAHNGDFYERQNSRSHSVRQPGNRGARREFALHSGGTNRQQSIAGIASRGRFGIAQTAQIVSAAAQGAGGVYGVVQSAGNGNAAGVLAGALEAAAAGATGIGLYNGGQTQATLSAIAAGLGTAGVATAVASDFAGGNLAQGLVDSLNLYLPAVAQAFVNAQTNQTDAGAGLEGDFKAIANAYAQYNAAQTATIGVGDPIAEGLGAAIASQSINGGQTGNPTPQYSFTIDTAAFEAAVAAAGANAVPDLSNAIGGLSAAATPPANAASETVSIDGATYRLTVAPDSSTGSGASGTVDVTATPVGSAGQSTSDTILATAGGIANDVMSFLGNLSLIGTAQAATVSGPPMSVSAVQAIVAVNNNSSLSTDFITAMTMQESTMNATTILNPLDPNTPEGLMQVTPFALKQVQSMYPSQFGGFTPRQLTDPIINVEVGTAYLQYCLDKANGNLSTALAYYGTGSAYAGPLQAGAAYLGQAGVSATANGLYNSIHNALITH